MINIDYYEHKDIDRMVHGVHASCQKMAIEMCLELLGSRIEEIKAVLPVTTPPDILSGVLRSGCTPVLLDIDTTTLSFNENILQEIVQEDNIVFIQPILGGSTYNSPLLKDHVLIKVHKELPTPSFELGNELFSLFDMSSYLGGVATVHSQFTKQLEDLRLIRDGSLGHYSQAPNFLASSIEKLWNNQEILQHSHKIVKIYQEELFDFSMFLEAKNTNAFFIKVEDACRSIDKLREYNVEARLGVFPLFDLPEIRDRWIVPIDENNYTNAISMKNRVVALPTHMGVSEKCAKKISAIIKNT